VKQTIITTTYEYNKDGDLIRKTETTEERNILESNPVTPYVYPEEGTGTSKPLDINILTI